MRQLLNVKTLSIIGMQKNVGKTTVLNHIIKELADKRIGITSIGRDGEKEDSVYFVDKPRIYVNEGTFVATTNECLKNSSAKTEVIKKTGFNTPMGEVIIVKIIDTGFIDIAGPSFSEQINEIITYLNDLVDIFIVDGAFSRKQIASNKFMEATILVTGAAYNKSLKRTVDDTYTTYKLLSLPIIQDQRIVQLINKYAVSLIDDEGSEYIFDLKSSLGNKELIISKLSKSSKYLMISGALTAELVNQLIDNRNKLNKLTIIIKDGTKAFIDYDLYKKLNRINVKLQVINQVNLVLLTYNPYSPYGYEYKDHEFKKLLEEKIDLPIINVLTAKGNNHGKT